MAVATLQLFSAPLAQANPTGTGLIINEVYAGGGSSGRVYDSRYVELYNPTSQPIDLTNPQLYLIKRNATDGGVKSEALSGTVPPRGYWLVAGAGAVSTPPKPLTPAPDQTLTFDVSGTNGLNGLMMVSTVNSFAGTGNLAGNASVIDAVGSGATYEGTKITAASNTAHSYSRTSHVDTDNNAADFTAQTPSPQNSSSTGGGDPEPLEASTPSNKSFYVGLPITPFTLAASGGKSPYTWGSTTLPAGLALNASTGEVTGTPSAAGTFEVTVTVTDSATPTPATDEVAFTITVDEAPTVRPIAEVQGNGARSPFAPAGNGQGDEVVAVEGVVTAMYRTGGYNGMYVQTPGPDSTPGASDAIFVWGNGSMPAGVEIGDSVRALGTISEFGGTNANPATLTELTPIANGVVELESSLGTAQARAIAFPATDEGREAHEGELLAPTDTFTVTNAYSTNSFADVGLAVGDEPLKQPTEHVAPSDAAGIAAIKADNYARAVTLDDGSSTNYMNGSARNQPLPYLSVPHTGGEGRLSDPNPNPPRVGAEATFQSPVILEWRNSLWKFQPRSQVTTNGNDVVTFEDTRAQNAQPQNVGGDLKIATFNVLNYFNTTGEAYEAASDPSYPQADTHCTYYTDRAGARIGNNSCGLRGPGVPVREGEANDGRGPRGAATDISLARQEEKLVNTLNLLDADVVALEEIENSIKLPGESNRDDAVADLVRQLNEAAGETVWAYVASPAEAVTSAAIAEQDVIRNAFIYKVATVEPVGESDMLFGTTEFANAREPLAQVFKKKGGRDSDGFALIVNHFKSKGDSCDSNDPVEWCADGDNANDTETGVGAYNGDRTRQATRLVEFANDFAEDRGVGPVFLAGDFNSYSKEQPVQIIEAADFTQIESDTEGEETYSFSGLSGSLDHIFANPEAMAMTTGADVWSINSAESVAFQYSRHNYNVTDFWQPHLPFGTSDHDPEIVGIDVSEEVEEEPAKQIQIIGTNDFHGRLLPDGGNAAGAAALAGKVNQLRAENPNTIFVAAGDLVGASTFESFIQQDEPTIDALNAAGLEVSAAGNHEFDRGYDDFVNRIQDSAQWEYIAANVQVEEGMEDLAEVYTKEIDGLKVGFVGAVTEDLPNLVSGNALDGVTITDVVDSVNTAAAGLKAGADPVDVVVALVHEGAPTTDCGSAGFTDPATVFGNIAQNTSADVDAIISGHTHLAYNCRFTVQDWVDEDRAVTKRPVVSAGQYGANLNQLVLSFDDAGELIDIDQSVVAAAGVGAPEDATVKGIVDDAVAYAEAEGAKVLGKIAGPFRRAAYTSSGTAVENRGGESTLGNLVAEVQRWATADSNGADIAFMNPGGLRADMVAAAEGNLTYRQAADVQPFANTLVNMELTGAQIKTVLEQQWQRTATGTVPSRPFLRLGVSEGFTYTYTERPERVAVPNSTPVDTFKGTVTGMWLNGEPVDLDATYSVTVNSFLGGGGDNFWELANGANTVDTGKVDLQAMVDYMAQFDTGGEGAQPLAVDYSQRAVEVSFPVDAPASYGPGDTVKLNVASWSMTADGDQVDSHIDVMLGQTSLGTVPVNSARGTQPYDEAGTASVSVPLPESVTEGKRTLRLVGATTGTSIPVEIQVDDGQTRVQVLATNDFHGRLARNPNGAEAGAAVLAGAVKQLRAENPNTVFAAAGDLIGASTFDSFIQDDKPTIDVLNEAGLEVSAVGNHELDKGYDDLVNRVMAEYDAESNPFGGAEWEYIAANLDEPGDANEIAPSWTQTFGDVQIGFVGAITEHLDELVSPAGIQGVDVTDVVTAVNDEADALKAGGADVVVVLVHEGAPAATCATMDDDPTSDFGSIITGVNANVDAIVSGHTHLAYDCSFPVAAWSDRAVTERPVVSAGQYGYNLNRLEFVVDDATGQLADLNHSVVALQTCTVNCPPASGTQTWVANFPADSATAAIVSDAEAKANTLGAAPLGQIAGAFNRARLANGTSENRGGESTLGNLVAEVQRWATETEEAGDAQIAFMNPGGLRADMTGTAPAEGSPAWPRTLTYRQAANVQSFANTLVNMRLTGANIKAVLEQQWQPQGASRPFLRLGVSEGFRYTYDPSRAEGDRITGMWLDGVAIDSAATYSVTANSFLAAGGDNFTAFNSGMGKRDTGKVDLAAMVEFMDEFADPDEGDEPLPVDYAQRAVGVKFPAGAPASYRPGQEVAFALSSLAMSTAADAKDAEVEVRLGDEVLGTFPVDNTLGSDVRDEYGTANVRVTLPNVSAGPAELTVVGETTGTQVTVPIQVAPGGSLVADDVSTTWGAPASIAVRFVGNQGPATGGVVLVKDDETVHRADLDESGAATLVPPLELLDMGANEFVVRYPEGPEQNYDPSETTVTVTVTKAAPTVTAPDVTSVYGQDASVVVTVDSALEEVPSGSVTVSRGEQQLGEAVVDAEGRATVSLDVDSLAVDAHQLTAAYSGDEHFAAGSDGLTLTVGKAAATVSAPDVSVDHGADGSIEVTVESEVEVPTGSVTVTVGEGELGTGNLAGGKATVELDTSDLAPGSHELTLSYSGNDHLASATGSASLEVGKATPTVSAGNVSVTYPQTAMANVTVDAGTLPVEGTVQILRGTDLVTSKAVAGTGTVTTSISLGRLAPDTYGLTARFVPTPGDNPLVEATDGFTLSVAKAKSRTDVNASPKKVKVRGNVTVKVKVTATGVTPTGVVQVKAPGVNKRVTLRNGSATVKVRLASKGTKTITATYLGDRFVSGSKDTVRVTVRR